MSEPIEDLYFNWLCAKVCEPKVPVFLDLMRILYTTEYVWLLPEDQNRKEDGVELRTDFLRESFMKSDPEWLDEPCSVLEMLIAFAKRAAFQTDHTVKHWFWQFLNNLRLDEYRRVGIDDELIIREILYNFVWRIYAPNGDGGLFPIRDPKHDQRGVEIWYQFCEYLEDQCLI